MQLAGAESGGPNPFACLSEERKRLFGRKVFEMIMKERREVAGQCVANG